MPQSFVVLTGMPHPALESFTTRQSLSAQKTILWFYLHDPLDVSLRVVVVAKEVILNRFYDGSLKRTT